jgi:hypothetical protein
VVGSLTEEHVVKRSVEQLYNLYLMIPCSNLVVSQAYPCVDSPLFYIIQRVENSHKFVLRLRTEPKFGSCVCLIEKSLTLCQ